MKALLDTNILIDYLNGIDSARREITLYTQLAISPISWMEVMVGTSKEDEAVVRRFLSRFQQIAIDNEIAERAVALRRQYKMRLPDAIIWGSAQSIAALLITRNTRDFPATHPSVRIPYQIESHN